MNGAPTGDHADMDYLLASAAVLSAFASVISAWLALRSNRSAEKKDRESRIRELSLIAHRVVAATMRVDDLANQLKLAYQNLFTFAGQGAGSSRLELYTTGIERKQEGIVPMQHAARETLEGGVDTLSDDQINERLLKLEGHLAHLDRVREKFHFDLASVESEIRSHRHSVFG